MKRWCADHDRDFTGPEKSSWLEKCLLCQEESEWLLQFAPADDWCALAGEKPGTCILYSLCSRCRNLPDRRERCEAVFLSEEQVQ